MFKLPRCPYCGRNVGYTSAFVMMGEKNSACRKCGKLSSVRFKAACARLAAVFIAALTVLNTLMFFKGNNRTLLPHFIVTVLIIFVYILLTPFKVKLIELEGQRDPEPKLKKNRHRHRRTKYKDTVFDENPLKGTSFDE